MKKEQNRPVTTVVTALDILEFVKANKGATLAEVVEEIDIARSTAHRHLQTLVEKGYVTKEENIYDISLKFLEYGIYSRSDHVYHLAKSKTKELANKTAERVQFIVEYEGKGIYVYRKTGENAVHTDPGIGKSSPLHATAAGKSILAHLPDPKVQEVIDEHGLPALTDNTITDIEALYTEFEKIHERGYSINNQEDIDGIRGLGAPILSKEGDVIGALSVSGPTQRMNDEWFEEDLPKLILGATNEVELNAAYANSE